jgi:hypothetical protein
MTLYFDTVYWSEDFHATLNRIAWLSFHSHVGEICTLLVYHPAHSANYLQTFRDNLSVPDKLSRNVGKELPLWAA